MMKSLNLYYRNNRLNIFTPLVIAVVLTLFLFFIDEGYYSFEWMLKPWNYYPFAIYVTGFVLGQCIVASFLYRKLNGIANALVVFLLGLPFGLIISLIIICIIGFSSMLFQ